MNSGSRILIVDDDEAVRLRLTDLLGRLGLVSIHETADGPSGLTVAASLRPDLILLDIMMPGMTGLEVCAELRARPGTREIPIIVLSAAEESEAMIAALEAGADDFLRKPFYAPELTAKVRTITRVNRYRALAAERDRFRWMLDHSLEPLVVADQRGRLVCANERARAVFGAGLEPGADVASAVGRHFQAEPADAWAAWRELRWPRDEPFAIYQPESEQLAARWFRVELHALDADTGETLIKFTNRTGAVRHELETYTFQHLISHKIRTPLNGLGPILAFLEETDATPFDAETRGLLGLARESAERLQQTLTGILNYHGTLFGAASPARRLAPRQSLTDVLADAAEAAGLPGKVELAAPSDLRCAPELCEFVLTEVFDNYAKFSSAKSAMVQVAVKRDGGRWTLELFSPGPSLPPEVLAQLGRPYAQLERSFTGEVPGLGLGLAHARMLLRSNGGDLVFDSRPDQSGVLTRVHLPATAIADPSSDADFRTY